MWQHRPALTPYLLALWTGALVYAIVDGPSVGWLAAYGVHFFLFSFGVAFGLHRSVAHQNFALSRALRNFSATVGVIAQGGSPMSWQTAHLKHHAHADEDGDPHAPSKLGWRVIFGAADPVAKDYIIERALKDPGIRDPYLLFLHKYYYLIAAVFAALMFLIAGEHGLIFLAILPIGLSMLSLGMLNYFAHAGNEPRNVWWLFPLTFGENWHANHHRRPRAQTSGEKFYELDMIAWITRPFYKKEYPGTAPAYRENRSSQPAIHNS